MLTYISWVSVSGPLYTIAILLRSQEPTMQVTGSIEGLWFRKPLLYPAMDVGANVLKTRVYSGIGSPERLAAGSNTPLFCPASKIACPSQAWQIEPSSQETRINKHASVHVVASPEKPP